MSASQPVVTIIPAPLSVVIANLSGGEAPLDTGETVQRWLDGIGYNQANLAWDTGERTLASGANEDLDLVGGFNNPFGTTQSPAKIKAVLFLNYNENTQKLTVKSAASNGWTGMITGNSNGVIVPPGSSQMAGRFEWIAPQGVAITAGTGDLINVLNSSGESCIYQVIVVGTSA